MRGGFLRSVVPDPAKLQSCRGWSKLVLTAHRVPQVKVSDDGDPFGMILAEQFPVFKKSPPTSPWSGTACPVPSRSLGSTGPSHNTPHDAAPTPAGPDLRCRAFLPRRFCL